MLVVFGPLHKRAAAVLAAEQFAPGGGFLVFQISLGHGGQGRFQRAFILYHHGGGGGQLHGEAPAGEADGEIGNVQPHPGRRPHQRQQSRAGHRRIAPERRAHRAD